MEMSDLGKLLSFGLYRNTTVVAKLLVAARVLKAAAGQGISKDVAL
jgi:hypothetical protein